MTISDSTLTTDVWNDVRSLIVAASIVTTTGASTSAVNVTASYPDKVTAKPVIVINPVNISEADFKFGGSYGKMVINVVVELVASAAHQIDQMSDQLRVAMSANNLQGLNLVEVSEDFAFNSPGETKAFMKTLTYSFMRESHA